MSSLSPATPLNQRGKYRFREFEIDLAHRSLKRGGHAIAIGSRTFDLLAYFVAHPQRVVTRAEVMGALWPDSEVEESNLGQHIFLLRKALTASQSGDKLILGVPGRGYEFTAPVTEIAGVVVPSRLTLEAAGSGADSAVEDVDGDEQPERGSLSRFFAGFRHPGAWHVFAVVAAVAILGFGALFGWRWKHRVAPQPVKLVLADFDNATGEPDFDVALKTAAAIDLEQSPVITVASRTQVEEAMRARNADGSALSPQSARAVCSQIHGQGYVTGSIRRLVRKYMVALEVFDCASGRSLAESKGIANSPDGIVDVLGRVTADLRRQLGEPASSVGRFNKPLFGGRAASLIALKAYADANQPALGGKPQDAILLLQRAVELDPDFTLASADLGVLYSNAGQEDLARAALSKAYEQREMLEEPERFFLVATYERRVTGDLEAGIRNDQSWSEEYPQNPVPLIDLAGLQVQAGRPGQAIEPAMRALRLNPDNAYAYEILAGAQVRLNQVDPAAETCRQALDHGYDNVAIHKFLLEIAFLRLDQAGIDSQMAWARGKSAEPEMLYEQGLMDFALGKAKAGQAAVQRAAEAYRRMGQSEDAAALLGKMPRMLAEVGLVDAARSQLEHLPEADGYTIPGSVDIPVAWAHAGETARAEAILKRELETRLTNTLWQKDYGPQIQAAIALNQQHPAAAIEELAPAIPYEMRSFDVPALRGKAYLADKQPELAEAEFHKIVDHPGIEPLSYNYALARLGLARALAMEGKTTDAENAYNLLFNIWKDADSDLPRLRDAHAEDERLTGTAAKVAPSASKHSAAKPRRK